MFHVNDDIIHAYSFQDFQLPPIVRRKLLRTTGQK